jgi:PAS domain S-box-containing protein
MPTPLTCLLVEDSEQEATLLIEALRHGGYNPTFERVQTEESMRTALGKQRWDVVFCEYTMPQFSAHSAFQVLRESRSPSPFIVVSGEDGEKPAVEALKFGADDYLPKNNLVQLVPSLKRSLRDAEYRKQRDSARHRNEQIMFHSMDMICTIDDQSRFVEVSAASMRILGYEPHELEGQKFTKFLHPADIKSSQEEVDLVLKGRVTFNFENRYLRKDGVAAFLSWSASWAAADRLLFCVARDITNQKVAEETLRQSEAMFRLMVEHVADYVILMLDPNGRIKTWNAGAERANGYKVGEILGQSHSRFFAPEDISEEKPAKLLLQAANEGRAAFEGWHVRKDGSRFWVSTVLTAVRNAQGKLVGFVKMTHDLTERKKAEEQHQHMELQLRQAQKLEAIGQLAAGIAHEINNPTQFTEHNLRFLQESFPKLAQFTNSYEAILSGLKTGTVPQPQLDELQDQFTKLDLGFLATEIPVAIDEALQGTDRINKIVRAMKEFSHPGKADNLRPEPASLNRAIETTIIVARSEWKHVAEMITEFDPQLPLVPVFLGEFNQVVLNLLVNASHALAEKAKDDPQNKGIITVSTRRDGDWVEIGVRDNGSGIPERIRHRIFEPFFTTKEIGRGTGQGLSIAHSVITKKHAGDLRFETETGKGTRFIIRLPLNPPAPNHENHPEPKS